MNLTATLLIFPNGGCWLTIMKPKSWLLLACSCLSTMQLYSVSATSSDVPSTATTTCFSCGLCISPLFHIGHLLIPTDLDVCSVLTVAHPKSLKILDTPFHPRILNNTTLLSVTTSCHGNSAGVYGVSVLVTWQQPWFTSVSSFWDLFTLTLPTSSLSSVWSSLDNWSLSISLTWRIYILVYPYCFPLLLLSPTFCECRHLVMADAILLSYHPLSLITHIYYLFMAYFICSLNSIDLYL